MTRAFVFLENTVAAAALAAMVLLPLLEILLRRTIGAGIPAAGPIVQHLVLWVGFLGAAIAAREGKLLSLATGAFVPHGAPRRVAAVFTAAVASAAAIVLAFGAVELIRSEREAGSSLGAGIPTWMAQLVLPIGFMLIAARLVWRSSERWSGRSMAALGIFAGVLLGRAPSLLDGAPAWPGVTIVILAGALGAPIFAILGGTAAVLFITSGITPAAILIET